MLEKTPEIPLDCKEINQSILREISPEYLLEGLMLNTSVFWSFDANSRLIGKGPDAGKG